MREREVIGAARVALRHWYDCAWCDKRIDAGSPAFVVTFQSTSDVGDVFAFVYHPGCVANAEGLGPDE